MTQTQPKTSDVVVVGGGIMGCATAAALSRRGIGVTLLEAGLLGQGASGATFAWINATSKINDEIYFRLNADGLATYHDLAREWGAGVIGLHHSGMIEWTDGGDEEQKHSLRAALERLRKWGYPAAALDRSGLAELEPEIRFHDGAEGYLAEHDGWLDVPVFLRFLIDRLGLGAAVVERCAAVELLADDTGKVLGLNTERGRIDCGAVVIATGPATPDVLARLTGYQGFASRFPVLRAPGLLVRAPAGGVRTRHVLYTPDKAGLHLRDAGGGELLIAADDADGRISEDASASSVHETAAGLLDRVRRFVPGFDGAGALPRSSTVVGIRAVPADGRAIAGPALSAEGLYLAVTHSGVTLAPVLSELLAECIQTGAVPDRLTPYGLDRFD